MGLEDLKKQVILLRDAVIILGLQDRIEILEYIDECFGNLRYKPLTYEEQNVNEVLNLTKKDYFPLDNPYDFQDPYSSARWPYVEPQNLSTISSSQMCYQYADDNEPENLPLDDWQSETAPDPTIPVNLVLYDKDKGLNSVKKSRRKQMFTRKSVRRLVEKSSQIAASVNIDEEKMRAIKCIGCGFLCRGNSNFSSHLKNHEPVSLTCRVCRSTFVNLSLFYRHKEDKKCRAKTGYVCSECGAKFKFVSQYMKHVHGHRDNNCKHCSEKFSSRALSRDHLKKCHPDVQIDKDLIPCKFCPMSFPRHHRLYNHYKLHHAKGKFVCTSCGLFLPTKEKHKEHMLDHEHEKKWKCETCGKKFFSVNVLTNHVKIHNSGIYKCITCNTTVVSIAELKVHKRNKHKVLGLEPKFECEKCHKMFPKKSILQRHMYVHSEKNQFFCKECSKSFSTLDGLVKHQKSATHLKKANVILPESKYEKLYEDHLVCESCGKQYKTYTQLIYHLRTHKGTYSCEICHKTFTLKINLRRHLRAHENNKAAICELCGDSFARVSALKDHMTIKHSDKRPVKCSVCTKTFKRNSALNRHMRIHENVRPFVCFCGRDYKQSAHLRSHQKAAHGSSHVQGFIEELAVDEQKRLRALDEVEDPSSFPQDILERDRSRNYGNVDHGSLLGLDNFEEHDYRLHESFKVPYVGDDYCQPLGYGDLHFGAAPSVSPAVDLTMVAISDVVCRDLDTGLIKTEAKSDSMPPDASSSIQLVNLSEHVVQEYLLNLP